MRLQSHNKFSNTPDAPIEHSAELGLATEPLDRIASRLRKSSLIWGQAEPNSLRFSNTTEWLKSLVADSSWMRHSIQQVVAQWEATIHCAMAVEAISGCWVLPAGKSMGTNGVSRGFAVAITKDILGALGSLRALCQSANVDFELTRDLLRDEPAIECPDIPRLCTLVSLIHPVQLCVATVPPTVEALLRAIETTDGTIREHSERTSILASRLANACSLSSTEQETARLAGLLHDVGKMRIPREILQKPGALTAQERVLVNMHPEMGQQLVSGLYGLESTEPAVLWHHERWDGAGYPDRISGQNIPVVARIMSVVDSFDAMRRNRPYRKSMSIEASLQEVRDGAGHQFDPKIANTFIRLITSEPSLAA